MELIDGKRKKIVYARSVLQDIYIGLYPIIGIHIQSAIYGHRVRVAKLQIQLYDSHTTDM